MRSWFSLAVLFLSSSLALAAEPAVEVRVRSVNDLLGKAEYLGGVLNQPEAARQGVEFIRSLADVGGAKGIEGIDPARPVGLYARLTKDVVDSPVVLMIPLADEQAFLDLLTSKLNLEPKKGDGGTYEVQVPNSPAPVFFRFAHRHVYATLRSRDGIAKKELIDPKVFFAGTDDAIASVKLHIDRVPTDVRKTLFGQFELQLNDAKAREQPGDTLARRKLRSFALDQFGAVVHTLITEGKGVALRLVVEPKSDELVLELNVTPAPGSSLAKLFREVGGPAATAPVLAGVTEPVAAGSIRFTLPDSVRQELAPLVDAMIKEEIDQAKENDRPGVRMVLNAVAPTLKAGEIDAAVAVTAADERLRLIAGLKVAEGAGIEQTLRTFAPFIPDNQGKIEFDVKKVGGLPVHKATSADPNLEAAFGTKTVWVATGKSLLLVGIEPEGKRLGEVAGAAPAASKPVRPLSLELSAARLLALSEKALPAETMKELTREAFPNTPVGKDTVRLTVDGGEAMTARLVVKGAAVRLAVLVDQEKKK